MQKQTNVYHLVIDDIVKEYSDVSKRSISRSGECMYKHKDKVCAFAYAIKPESRGKLREGIDATGHYEEIQYSVAPENCVNKEDFKEEYQPIWKDYSFWNAIQNLHDTPKNWSDTGLSEVGKDRVEQLKKEYDAEQTNADSSTSS